MFKFLEIVLAIGLSSFIVIYGGYWLITKVRRIQQKHKEQQEIDKILEKLK